MDKEDLLKKIRLIKSEILTRNFCGEGDLSNVTESVNDVLRVNVYIINFQGFLVNYTNCESLDCEILKENCKADTRVSTKFNYFLLKSDETRINLGLKTGMCLFFDDINCLKDGLITTIIPILAENKRIGTLIAARKNEYFNEEDIVLLEIVAAVLSTKIVTHRIEKLEKEARQKRFVKQAVNSLSFYEYEVVKKVLKDIGNLNGVVKICNIATELKVSRSRAYGALAKLRSAGVIELKPRGKKGTTIEILNPYLIKYLESELKEKF